MRLEVAFSPQAVDPDHLVGHTAIVIDILRATTTMCAALHHGAKAVVPTGSPDQARTTAQLFEKHAVLLAGEQHAVPIPGFDLGNSPRDMTRQRVEDKTVVMSTTNGTQALLAAASARAVYPGAACNFSLLATLARQTLEADGTLVILCAGRAGASGLDDAYCAGRLVMAALNGRDAPEGLSDAAIAAVQLARRFGLGWDVPLRLSAAGRHLERLGLGADIDDAAKQDGFPALIRFRDGRVTLVEESP
ncbi:MAG: 2-phosphosulfolactate phosphatase [Gemmatimonadales bacterium]|nr:2-phosphosulfolactate phosphatase [Gemmatimonadales bacterium]